MSKIMITFTTTNADRRTKNVDNRNRSLFNMQRIMTQNSYQI